jgi:UTP--glucose-1-phosphate uridylyltransferase
MKRVRKAVFPVAGLGTRVLPATKTIPKEMLTVVDRPLIHYVVEEARAAGIEHFVFVTGRGKSSMEDYFDHHVELEATLEKKNKTALLRSSPPRCRRRARSPTSARWPRWASGHAVWCARDIIGDEPFAVLLPDMIMDAQPAALRQAVDAYERRGGNIVVVEPCPPGQAHQYGIVALTETEGRVSRMTGMVEKPAPGTEPSNLFISGRYILQPEIFRHLSERQAGAGGEIQLTDAMAKLMAEQDFFALEYEGPPTTAATRSACCAPTSLWPSNAPTSPTPPEPPSPPCCRSRV